MSTVVGQVAVKVIPDTKQFATILKSKLKAIEKASKLEIKAKLDAKGLQAEARAEAKKASRNKIRLRVDETSADSVRNAMQQIERELERLREKTIKVKLNEASLRAAKEKLDKTLLNAEIVLGVDKKNLSSVQSAIAAIKGEIAKIKEQELRVKVNQSDLSKTLADLQKIEKVELDRIKAVQEAEERRLRGEQYDMKLRYELWQQAEKRYKDGLAEMERAAARVADNDVFRKAMERANEALKNVVFKPEMTPSDIVRFQRSVQGMYDQIDRLKLKITPDLSDRDKEQLRREIANIEANIEVAIGEASQRTAQIRLAFLGRTRFVTFRPVVDKLAAAQVGAFFAGITGGRLFSTSVSNIFDMFKNADKAVPKVMLLTTALANLSSWLLTAISNTFTFGASLASIAGAGLALPGILGGLTIGVGATVAVMRDFNDVFPKAGEALDKLQDRMSDKFWTRAAKPFREFADTIFPQFSANIERTSSSLGRYFANLARAGEGILNGALRKMFDDLNRSIDIAGKYTGDFVDVIRRLGQVGAGNLPKLARWFGDITRSFNEWLAEKGRKGLQEFVDTGIAALKDLGGVIAATSSLLAGIARAAEKAGGSTLAIMRKSLEGAAEVVNSKSFQKNLVQVFEAAHKAMSLIAEKSGPAFKRLMDTLSDTLAVVLPTSGRTLGKAFGAIFDALNQPQVQASIVGFFKNIERTVDNLAPAMPKVADVFGILLDVMGRLGENVSRTLVPAFEFLYNLVNPIVSAFQALPGPVKDTVIQFGLAATAILYIGKQADIAKVKLAALAAQMQTAGAKGKALGTLVAAGGLAGGIALMNTEADKGASKLSILGSALSGAAMGGLVGSSFGPIGTAIGGIGGAATGAISGLVGYKRQVKEAADASVLGKGPIADYGATFDAFTGKVTAATRALVQKQLVESGAISQANALGIAQRDVINAVLGMPGAVQRVNAAINSGRSYIVSWTDAMGASRSMVVDNKKQVAELTEEIRANGGTIDKTRRENSRLASASGLLEFIQNQTDAWRNASREKRKEILATQDLRALYKSLPHKVATKINAEGVVPTRKGVADVAKKYKLLPKQIKSVIEAAGVPFTVRQIKRVLENMNAVKQAKADTKKWENGIDQGVVRGLKITDQGTSNISKKLKNGTANATANLKPFQQRMSSDLQGISGVAFQNSQSIGSNIASGAEAGVRSAAGRVAEAARAMVAAAMASARAEAKIKSPSRVTMGYGRFIAEGMAIGIQKNARKASRAAGGMTARALKAALKLAKKFNKEIVKHFNKVESVLRNRMKKAGDEGDKQLRSQIKRLNGFARKYKNLYSELTRAQRALNTLRTESRDFEKQVVEQIKATADPTRDGASSYEAIFTVMSIARDEAVAFQKVISELSKAGLHKDILKSLVEAGPEAALAAAQSILASGSVGITELNAIQKDINAAAADMGKTAADAVYGQDIKNAMADLKKAAKNLAPVQKKLTAAMRDMMRDMAKEAKKGVRNINAELAQIGKAVDPKKKSKPKSASRQAATAAAARATAAGQTTNILNYYAGNGPTLSSEEALFAAANRGRMVFGK